MNFREVSEIIKKFEDAFILTDNDLDSISSGILMSIILRKLGIRYKTKIRDHDKLDYDYLQSITVRNVRTLFSWIPHSRMKI